jgi:succinate dehydrogenase / fumarate reductase membrane anchor subunit
MKTPLGRVRGLGAAHSGTGHFWLQRLTAVANLFLVTGFLIVVVSLAGRSHATAIARLTNPFIALLVIAAVISVVTHMRIGMQVIIEDYVHSESKKVLMVMANTFFSIGIALATLYAILKINFGL